MSEEIKSVFDRIEYKRYKTAWTNRQNVLAERAGYYDGTVYEKLRSGLGWLMPRIYKDIKPLFLPLARAVDIDAGIVPGGWKLPENETKAEEWQKAIDVVNDWSNWDTEGVLYVHYGAMTGVSGLRISDLRAENRILVQPVDPLLFMTFGMAAYDNTPDISFMVEERVDASGDKFEYAEVITSEEIKTFAKGQPAEFDGRPDTYKNKLGFVPFVEVRHIETGKPYGECTFQRSIKLLDEVNKLASNLAENIGENAKPQWAIFGADPSELEQGADVAWFFPGGTDAKPLVPNIDIDGVLAFIKEVHQGVKDSLPELGFDELRARDQIATKTLELQLMELVLKIKRVRPNYDKGLKIALQMAGRAAESMGLGDIAVLNDPGLRFDKDRDILPASEEDLIDLEMKRMERDQLLLAAGITEGDNA